MSLFQCENCGCCENTAVSYQGFKGRFERLFDWSDIPDRKGMLLCSACGPTKFSNGKPAESGKWHGEFDRVYLPKGMFKTNLDGNLEHIETGETDHRKYALNAGLQR